MKERAVLGPIFFSSNKNQSINGSFVSNRVRYNTDGSPKVLEDGTSGTFEIVLLFLGD